MISLIVPYMLTFIGLIIDGAHDFLGMAIFLTVIGVVWTAIGAAMKGYSKNGLLMAEGVHGAIWIVCKFFPMFGAKLLGGLIGLAIAVPAAIFGYLYLIAPLFGGGETPRASFDGDGGERTMPNIIYDENNCPWDCLHRFDNGEMEYENRETGAVIRIYHSQVSGSQANTSAGTFHWY